MLSIAGFSYARAEYPDTIGSHLPDWLPLLSVIVCMFGHSLGVINTLQILIAEVFPTDIR